MVKSSPEVSMRVTPVFSWSSLILEPLGPMTMPTRFSGTFTTAVAVGPVGSVSTTSGGGAFMFKIRSTSAWAASRAVFGAAAGALYCCFCVGALWPAAPCEFLPELFAGASFWSSCLSLRFCWRLFMPVETSHAGPLPSSSWTLGANSSESFFGSSLASWALALDLALPFAVAFAEGSGAGAGAAGGDAAPALALAPAFAEPAGFSDAAFGAGSAFASALALALPLAFGSAAASFCGAA
mmetsp:Transcript_92251/g.265446  ORF Transcript_92251/g.265446 Transcript_92251/m.265446 type:complete len:239 (+) Transcript_92251:773-1489(+)